MARRTEKSKPLILIADDDANSQLLLKRLLDRNEFQVESALDGQMAVDKAREIRPDLILMDVQMPGIDGFEAVRLLREDQSTHRIPIIVVTAAAREPADVARGLGIGADDYLRKPFNVSELLARVNSKIRARRLEENLEKRTEELEALVRIGTELNQGLELDEVANRILSLTLTQVPASAAMLILTDEFRQPTLWRSFPDDRNLGSIALLHPRTLTGYVLNTGEALLIDDVADGRLDVIFDDGAGDSTCVSGIATPLKHQNQILGVLALGDIQPERFADGDLRVLRSIAEQATLAIRNAQLYAELHGYAQGLESMVEARTAALQAAQAQLIRAEKLAALGTLAAGVAHEVNNPLQAMLPMLEMALEDINANRVIDRESMEVTISSVQRIQRIVSQLLDFARPAQTQAREVDVNDALGEVLSLAGKQLQHSRVEVKIDLQSTHIVTGSADQLKQVFLNLVVNAMEAMPNGGTLNIRTTEKDGQVIITVRDTGIGIRPDEMPQIFNPFFTTKADGTGLGLAVSYGIIEGHGGQIEVDSKINKYTQFTVKLPIAIVSENYKAEVD